MFDWIKTRRRLEDERDWAADALGRMITAIDTVSDLDELRKFVNGEMGNEPVLRVLEHVARNRAYFLSGIYKTEAQLRALLC